MGFIKKIKEKIGYSILIKKISKNKREKAFINFDVANSIGVIFNASDSEHIHLSENFIKSLQQKDIKVWALGYVNRQEEIEALKLTKNIEFYPLKSCNWYYKPNSLVVDEFCDREMDILIDLSLDNYLQIKYIIGLSKARLKVGTLTDEQNSLYDFMLNLNKDSRLTFYIDQLNHYLSVIKTV